MSVNLSCMSILKGHLQYVPFCLQSKTQAVELEQPTPLPPSQKVSAENLWILSNNMEGTYIMEGGLNFRNLTLLGLISSFSHTIYRSIM